MLEESLKTVVDSAQATRMRTIEVGKSRPKFNKTESLPLEELEEKELSDSLREAYYEMKQEPSQTMVVDIRASEDSRESKPEKNYRIIEFQDPSFRVSPNARKADQAKRPTTSEHRWQTKTVYNPPKSNTLKREAPKVLD